MLSRCQNLSTVLQSDRFIWLAGRLGGGFYLAARLVSIWEGGVKSSGGIIWKKKWAKNWEASERIDADILGDWHAERARYRKHLWNRAGFDCQHSLEEKVVSFLFPHGLSFELLSTSICKWTVNAEDAVRRGRSEPRVNWMCDEATEIRWGHT